MQCHATLLCPPIPTLLSFSLLSFSLPSYSLLSSILSPLSRSSILSRPFPSRLDLDPSTKTKKNPQILSSPNDKDDDDDADDHGDDGGDGDGDNNEVEP